MENIEKLVTMKTKYLELGKKLWLKDEFLNTIEKELTEVTTKAPEKEESLKMEGKEEAPEKEEIPKEEILCKTCENQDSPVMVMIKKRSY